MKKSFDKHAKQKNFDPGDKVLLWHVLETRVSIVFSMNFG